MNPAGEAWLADRRCAGRAQRHRETALTVAGLWLASLAVLVPGALTPQTGAPSAAGELQLRIDPEYATRAELKLLPGIGEQIADAILAYREAATQRPVFRTIADLDAVPRVGPKRLSEWAPYLCFAQLSDVGEVPAPPAACHPAP